MTHGRRSRPCVSTDDCVNVLKFQNLHLLNMYQGYWYDIDIDWQTPGIQQYTSILLNLKTSAVTSRISSKLIFASCVGYFNCAYYGFYVTSSRMLVFIEGNKIWQLWNLVSVQTRRYGTYNMWTMRRRKLFLFRVISKNRYTWSLLTETCI